MELDSGGKARYSHEMNRLDWEPRVHWVVALTMTAAALVVGSPAEAQLSLREASEIAENGESRQEVAMALEALADHGRRAAPVLNSAAPRLPAELVVIALSSMESVGEVSSIPVVLSFLQMHRSVDVRAQAAITLARLHRDSRNRLRNMDREPAIDALTTALRDAHDEVREAAALGLATLRADSASEALLASFELGNDAAGIALAQVGEANVVERLFGHFGRRPMDTMTPIFMEVFAREDIPDDNKTTWIYQLGEAATPAVGEFLETLSMSLEPGPVTDAASDVAGRIR